MDPVIQAVYVYQNPVTVLNFHSCLVMVYIPEATRYYWSS